jgi:hypothetical protein
MYTVLGIFNIFDMPFTPALGALSLTNIIRADWPANLNGSTEVHLAMWLLSQQYLLCPSIMKTIT